MKGVSANRSTCSNIHKNPIRTRPFPLSSSSSHLISTIIPFFFFFMAAASSSLLLPSISPKALTISSRASALPLFSLVSSRPIKAVPLVLQCPKTRHIPIPRVALSSDFEEKLDEDADEQGGEVASFSPELKLFVGNLPFTVDSSELAGLFESVGSVEMVEVIYDKLTGKSRGFGFVTMSSVAEVEAAEKQFNGYELGGRPLRVSAGPPPRKDDFPSRGSRSFSSFNSSNKVYVGNLSWGVDKSTLESLFSEQGKVMDARVVYCRESGRSRGFGFVTYNTAEEVDNAISALNGFDLDGRNIRVMVAEDKPKQQF
ncbi:nucleolin protein [Dioscorea alata]|uniref:Nucleolin protein n=1 Tax=Dioscorea alata TaxID=55571 RepID=A0ACB7W8V1_DIOAL|nr:nucleolin protein [Dioscorea alata]